MQRVAVSRFIACADFVLSEDERRKIDTLTRIMQEEFLSTDHLQDEMLRVLLKRFIILCTRIAEDRQGAVRENSLQFETIRKFYVLVDTYLRRKTGAGICGHAEQIPEDTGKYPFRLSAAFRHPYHP